MPRARGGAHTWATVLTYPDGYLEAFGPFHDQNEATKVALQALDVIHDPQTPVPMTTDATPVELRDWPGRKAWGRS
jgi:hypothetical protein